MSGFEDIGGEPGGEAPDQGPEVQEPSRVMVLPVNGESKKITQTLSNETSLKILELLGKNSMSATDIADELKIPLTTVKYNLDSLVDSELIKVKQIKWSRKGREVKVYEAMEKLIVLVPSKSPVDKISIINLLQQYLGIIAAAVFAAAGIEYFSAYMRAKKIIDATAPLRMGMQSPFPTPVIEENETGNLTGDFRALDTEDSAFNEAPGGGMQNASSNGEFFTGNGSDESVQVVTEAEKAVKGVPTEEVQAEEVQAESTAQVENTSTSTEGGASVQNISSQETDSGVQIPSEGLGAATGYHGISDIFSAHPGVWFLFGCLFVIFLIIVRQVYYKKKAK